MLNQDSRSALGEFVGGDRSLDVLDGLQASFIPEKLWAAEPELMGKKWFDYRFLHPVEATYFLASCYQRAIRAAWIKNIDKETVDGVLREDGTRSGGVQAIPNGDLFTVRQLAAGTGLVSKSRAKLIKSDRERPATFWRLRQHIDALGLPYDFWTGHAVDWIFTQGWLEWDKPVWLKFPLAEHLVAESVTTAVCTRWDAWKTARIQVAADPRYRVDRYQGLAWQDEHQAFVLGQIKRRPSSGYALARHVFEEPVVTEAAAIDAFGPDPLDRARELFRENVSQH